MGAIYSKSGGGVIMNDKDEVVMIKQTGNVWKLPMGHIEGGETELAAAKREIFEETGVTRLSLLLEFDKYKRFKINLHEGDDENEIKEIRMYLFTTDEEKLAPHDDSIIDCMWVHKDKVAEQLSNKKDREFYVGILSMLNRNAE